MNSISNDKFTHVFSHNNEPVLYCNSGDIIEFNTLDCFGDKLVPEGTTLKDDAPRNSNPCTGPLFIQNAFPGDTLKVDIQSIDVGKTGVILIGPSEVDFQNKLTEYEIKRIPIKNKKAIINDHIEIPIDPMIGVIGVAPIKEVPTGLSGSHGGNMDCSEIKEGTSIYLPICIEGGLLSIGDLHALMGDGEIGGNGLEISGKVVVKVSVIKNIRITGPQIETNDRWMTVATNTDLERASLDAAEMMLEHLMVKHNYSIEDANLLLSLLGDIKVCKVGYFENTMRMEISKDIL